MDTEDRLTALEAQIEAMDTQLETVSAEFFGFRFAFAALISLIPVTERDVTAARELALAQAEDAMGSGDIPPELALAVFSTIQTTMGLAGDLWRHRGAHPKNSNG